MDNLDEYQSQVDEPAKPNGLKRGIRDAAMAIVGGIIVFAIAFLIRGDGAPVPASNPTQSGSDGMVNEAAETLVALSSQAPVGALASSREGLGSFPVIDVNGQRINIVKQGQAAIVMINSRTCGYCKAALRDIGNYAQGRPVEGLKLLTLEGAEHGAPMLQAAGIQGAVPIGPATSNSQVLLTFRYRGTPTFVAVDPQGHIRGTMQGYPGAEQLQPWFDVMLGSKAMP